MASPNDISFGGPLTDAAITAAEALAATGSASLLAAGTALADANATVNPGTDGVSVYVMPINTLSTGRVVTLGVTGTLVAGVSTVWIQCRDISANTLTVRNGGTNGTSISDIVIPAARGKPMAVGATYDGVDWVPHSLVYVT